MNRIIINALPLVANAIGRKYGVQVHIGGSRAYTDGKDIHLPALPLEADEDTLQLVRGYLDHESAHLRHTDFDLVASSKLEPLEKHVWNILEDVMVEEKLGAIYPGCKQNLRWLVKKIFLDEKNMQAHHCLDVQSIFNWLLMKVRSRTVPELEMESRRYESAMDVNFPNLRQELEQIISRSTPNPDTRWCMEQARELVRSLKNFVDNFYMSEKGKKGSQPTNIPEMGKEEDDADASPSQRSARQLKEMMAHPDKLSLRNLGEEAGKLLEKVSVQSESAAVAKTVKTMNPQLSGKDVYEARRHTVSLRSRLSALLQSKVICRRRIGSSGKIMTNKLAGIAVNNGRIFMKHEEKGGVNTAVHLLVDVSGSMSGEKIRLAGLSAYALVEALKNVKGVSLGVSSFPNGSLPVAGSDQLSWETVNPVLRHNEKPHKRFALTPNGSTPMAAALWWALQQMISLKEKRKIVLIISDGEPDSLTDTINAINACNRYGIEVYGIGIQAPYITHLLPGHSSFIWNLSELAPAMFGLLQDAMLKGGLK